MSPEKVLVWIVSTSCFILHLLYQSNLKPEEKPGSTKNKKQLKVELK